MGYSDFIARKLSIVAPVGLADVGELPPGLFPHQEALTRWALRRGRAAIFADTGLGKTRMELAWSQAVLQATNKPILILAPLAVAPQTVMEGERIGVEVVHAREPGDIRSGINITNYDRLHKFDPSMFGAIVADESGVLKHHETKTFSTMTEAFARTPYKLCATATPAPNDWTELGTHAEFLGVCTRQEMLAEYFVHDGGETQVWRLKGHARQEFWRFVSSWGAMVKTPADLGFDDSAYRLPPLQTVDHEIAVESEAANGALFALEAQSLTEQRAAKRASLGGRVEACAELVNADREQWLVWTELNDESAAVTKAIPSAIEVRGSTPIDEKERALLDFAAGKIRVLVTKSSIAGWGLNFQRCARQAFVGPTNSFESYYQSVRRSWRFGQTRPVEVHLFYSELERAIVRNLKRKEADAEAMGRALTAETHEAVIAEVLGQTRRTNPYNAARAVKAPSWLRSEAS